MIRTNCLSFTLVALMPLWTASAEILSITASAETSLTEFVEDQQTASEMQLGEFPSSKSLPLQVIAERVSDDEQAAGIVAVQFADPAGVDTSNPQEFAVNLALTSESETTRYTSSGQIVETRTVLFSPGEIVGTIEGDTLQLVGTLFLDGTMSLLTADAFRDISGASTSLMLTVEKRSMSDPNAVSETLFSGGLTFEGTPEGEATASVSGDFPTESILVTDLAVLLTEFDGASVLILPQIEIDYAYSALVGEEFELVVTLSVEADNLPNETAALILLGLPLDALSEAVGQVQSQLSAKELIDALEARRLNPEGTPAFEARTFQPDDNVGFGFCGSLGFVSLLGFATMTWRTRR